MKHIKRSIFALLLILLLMGCSTELQPIPTTTSTNNDLVEYNAKESMDLLETVKQTFTDNSLKIQTQEKTQQEAHPPQEQVHSFDGSQLEVHFIDVGQGSAQLIIFYPNNGQTKAMLIDAGDNDDEQGIVTYLKTVGIKTVDILIGTHPHADHIGGLDAVIHAFDIGKIYMPAIAHNTKTFEDVLDAAADKGLKITRAKAGLKLDLHDDLDTQMLGPVGDYGDLNNASAVVRLSFNESSFLFTGDAEDESERDILKSGALQQTDVYVAGHHGSSTSSTPKFLSVVKPSFVVVQSGAGNSYGHPHREAIQRFNGIGATIYRNDTSGHIIASTDGKTIQFQTSKTQAAKPNTKTDTSKDSTSEIKNLKVTALSMLASIDNEAPAQNEKVAVTAKLFDQDGNVVPGAEITIVCKFKSKDTTYKAVTNQHGEAIIPFYIGRSAIGYEVKVLVTATKDGIIANAETSFTAQ